jgi:hypothetical protein
MGKNLDKLFERKQRIILLSIKKRIIIPSTSYYLHHSLFAGGRTGHDSFLAGCRDSRGIVHVGT